MPGNASCGIAEMDNASEASPASLLKSIARRVKTDSLRCNWCSRAARRSAGPCVKQQKLSVAAKKINVDQPKLRPKIITVRQDKLPQTIEGPLPCGSC